MCQLFKSKFNSVTHVRKLTAAQETKTALIFSLSNLTLCSNNIPTLSPLSHKSRGRQVHLLNEVLINTLTNCIINCVKCAWVGMTTLYHATVSAEQVKFPFFPCYINKTSFHGRLVHYSWHTTTTTHDDVPKKIIQNGGKVARAEQYRHSRLIWNNSSLR